jgi:hypothetical protein
MKRIRKRESVLPSLKNEQYVKVMVVSLNNILYCKSIYQFGNAKVHDIFNKCK